MNFFKTGTIDNIVNSLGWTILHSLWQGLLLLVCFLLLIIIFRRKRAQFKYEIGLIVLILFLGSVIVTFIATYNYHHASPLLHSTTFNNSDASLSNNSGDGIADIQSRLKIKLKIITPTLPQYLKY